MTKLGISNSSILLDARNIKMGFAPQKTVQKLTGKYLVASNQLSSFQNEASGLIPFFASCFKSA